MKQRLNQWYQFVGTHKIILALACAVTLALAMTTISIWIYNVSDVARIDISRPGYEKARESVIKDNETITFGATGELDSADMKDFQKLFDEKRTKLNATGKFDGDVLSDDHLKTVTSE